MHRVCIWGVCLDKIADEAQLEAVLQILRTRLPDARLVLLSRDAEAIVARHRDVEAIDPRNLPAAARALATADLFAIVGGPFLEAAAQTLRCFILVAIAKLCRVPVVAYGATLFYFRTRWARTAYRYLFRSFEAIAVRERVAADILEDLGHTGEVSVFADPRFVLEPAPPAAVHRLLADEGLDPRRPLVLVTTRHFDDATPGWVRRLSDGATPAMIESTRKALAAAIDHVGAEAQVLFFPMHPNRDDDVSDAHAIGKLLRSGVEPRILSRRYSVPETLGIVAQAQLVLASRVAAGVFASVTSTPVVAIAHENRLADHMERMGDGDKVFDWSTLEPERFVACVREVWSEHETQRGRAQARAAEMQQLAWANSDVLEPFLHRPHADSGSEILELDRRPQT